MARAMVEIEPGFPQRQPRQHVELRAGRAFRKHCTRNADMALQHAREAVAHFGAGLADAQRARDVGGAVLILRAGIDEVEPFADDAIARLGHPVMHDGAIGPRTRDGGKGHILQLARLAAKGLKRLRRSDLRQLAALGRPRKPGEKAHHGRAVAQMRSARPLDLGGILAGLHQRDRIGADLGHAARAFQRLRELCGDGGGVEAHRRALLAQPRQIGQKLRGRGDVGQCFQCRAHIARQLARIDIEHGPAALGDQREGQRQRRMGDIGPTNVEGPRHCMRIADNQRCGLRERLFDALQFSRGLLAGIAFGMQAHRRQRRRRSVTPDVIEGIVLDRHEAGTGGLGRLGETAHLSRRQQPGIIADAVTGLRVLLQPFFRRGVRKGDRREDFHIDLRTHLNRVAPVHENGGRVAQHDGRSRRPGKASQPGQTLGAGRHIFVLVFVGARDDEPLQAALAQLAAQKSHARAALRGIRRFIESLEMALEHGRQTRQSAPALQSP